MTYYLLFDTLKIMMGRVALLLIFAVSPLFANRCCITPYLSIGAETVLLARGRQKAHCLVGIVDDAGIYRHCIESNNQLLKHDKWDWGWRGVARFNPDLKNSFEFAWMGDLTWDARSTNGDDGSDLKLLYYNNNTYNFQSAYRSVEKLKSTLNTYELNYYRWVTPQKTDYFSFAWTPGLRHFQINERFRTQFFRGSGWSYYKISTKNQYWGGQLGIDFEINPTCRYTFGVVGRGGIMINHGKMHAFQTDDNNGEIIRNTTHTGNYWSYMGEIRPYMSYAFFQYLNATISYEGLLISDAVLALSQIPYGSGEGNNIEHHGQAMYQGMILGIHFTY